MHGCTTLSLNVPEYDKRFLSFSCRLSTASGLNREVGMPLELRAWALDADLRTKMHDAGAPHKALLLRRFSLILCERFGIQS